MVGRGDRRSGFGFRTLLGLLALLVVATSGWSDTAQGRIDSSGQMSRAVSMTSERSDACGGCLASVASLRAGMPVLLDRGRVFAWPSRGSSTCRRATRMARHGDPEARKFVGGESDVNPFDVR
jgi:hypothetical protein